jgi:hypothetical protein
VGDFAERWTNKQPSAPVKDKQSTWRTWSWMKMMYKSYDPWQVENWMACAKRKGWEIPGEMVRWLHEQEVTS